VVWETYLAGEDAWRLFARRFDSAGGPRGLEFRVDDSTFDLYSHSVASDPAGNFVVPSILIQSPMSS
jgi:hypothetical protein